MILRILTDLQALLLLYINFYLHIYVHERAGDNVLQSSLHVLKLAVSKRVEALTKPVSKLSKRHLRYGG